MPPAMTKPDPEALRPDLHTHTTASDGMLNPEELVCEAAKQRINVLAVTDHDSISGLDKAKEAAVRSDIRLIPGIEIGCEGKEEVHILAYFVSDDMRGLREVIIALINDRAERALKFLYKLRALSISLSMEDLQIPPSTACSRPLIARALVRKGFASSVKEAFDRYLGVGKPAYVEKLVLKTEGLLGLLRDEGAVPVLAHPELIKNQARKHADQIKAWRKQGLLGIEAYHPQHTKADCARWDHTARDNGLLVTGGSDFHAFGDTHGSLGCMVDMWHTASKDARALLALSPQ